MLALFDQNGLDILIFMSSLKALRCTDSLSGMKATGGPVAADPRVCPIPMRLPSLRNFAESEIVLRTDSNSWRIYG